MDRSAQKMTLLVHAETGAARVRVSFWPNGEERRASIAKRSSQSQQRILERETSGFLCQILCNTKAGAGLDGIRAVARRRNHG